MEIVWGCVINTQSNRPFWQQLLHQLSYTDKAGNSILHYAAAAGASYSMLEGLIQYPYHVPISLTNSRGETFLHLMRPEHRSDGQYDWQRLLALSYLHSILRYVTHKGETIRQRLNEQVQQGRVLTRIEKKGLECDINEYICRPSFLADTNTAYRVFKSLGFDVETESQDEEYLRLYNLLADPELLSYKDSTVEQPARTFGGAILLQQDQHARRLFGHFRNRVQSVCSRPIWQHCVDEFC